MVSPFLSFLGGVAEAHRGALQELRTERAKKEALKEQRDYEEEAQKNRIIFAEKLKDAARIKTQAFDELQQQRLIHNDPKKFGQIPSIRAYKTGPTDFTTGLFPKGRDNLEDIKNLE